MSLMAYTDWLLIHSNGFSSWPHHVLYHFSEGMEANKFTPLTQSTTFVILEHLIAIISQSL